MRQKQNRLYNYKIVTNSQDLSLTKTSGDWIDTDQTIESRICDKPS